ncbi:glutamate receptor ionotropic, delta-1-like [Centruroides sculpturatus]|uniref:glutamate receptor ionotropic, delta-1-like n=1 Tax=Centruroides sculpturatus TaxID=218467 RepID=UPI000C6C98C3|nr:glutamate receptor ionotropic, delta-1-like [Centruroides sculpturatus]
MIIVLPMLDKTMIISENVLRTRSKSGKFHLSSLLVRLKPMNLVELATWPQNEIYMQYDENYRITGGELFNTFMTVLNKARFRYELVKPIPTSFGMKTTNGSWKGMIGQIVNKKADITFNSLVMTEERLKVIDYSSNVAFVRYPFMIKLPKKMFNWTSLIRQFSLEVWILMFTSTLICGLVIYKVLKEEARLDENTPVWTVSRAYWFLFGTFLNHGARLNFVVRFPSRIIIAVWLIATVVLVWSYTGILLSFMTTPKLEFVPRTVEELATTVKRGDFSCGTVAGNAITSYLMHSTELHIKIINNHIQESKNLFSEEDGFQKVLEGRFAFITEEFAMKQVLKKYDDKEVLICSDSVQTFTMGYGLTKGSIYKPIIDKIISRLFDAGITYYEYLGLFEMTFDSESYRPLMVEDLLSPIVLLLLGYMISVVCFFIELSFAKIWPASDIH